MILAWSLPSVGPCLGGSFMGVPVKGTLSIWGTHWLQAASLRMCCISSPHMLCTLHMVYEGGALSCVPRVMAYLQAHPCPCPQPCPYSRCNPTGWCSLGANLWTPSILHGIRSQSPVGLLGKCMQEAAYHQRAHSQRAYLRRRLRTHRRHDSQPQE